MCSHQGHRFGEQLANFIILVSFDYFIYHILFKKHVEGNSVAVIHYSQGSHYSLGLRITKSRMTKQFRDCHTKHFLELASFQRYAYFTFYFELYSQGVHNSKVMNP